MTTVANDDQVRFTRVPPQDLDAERCVLGGTMLDRREVGNAFRAMKVTDFYRPAHETIARAIIDLDARDEPTDPIAVTAELTKRGELTRVGGAAYLHELIQSVPSAANAEYYAEIVHERAVLRRLAEAGRRIEDMALSGEGEMTEVCNTAQAEVYAATEVTTADDPKAPGEGPLEEMFDELHRIENDKGQLTGVPTGLTDFDSLTQGLQSGQFIIIAARPAIGKSTLAMDIVRACSIKHALPSMFFSLEMGRNELLMRMMSAQARVGLHKMRSGSMTDDDWTHLAKAAPQVSAAPIYIDDSPNQTMMSIRSQCRRQKARTDLSLIVIDYLQLMQSGRKYENRQQEVSDMSRGLKLLAKELSVPVIAVCQLNRGPEQRTDKKPQVSDLRESGSLEQDADIVILLHREDAYEKESPRAGEADLIVGKHRNGPTATITVAFQGHYSRFVDMAQT